MDNIRDIQKTENISQFVDKQTIKTLAFGDNKMGERAYKKAERIVAAVYLLTNHLSPQEPIRNIIRENSALLLGQILEIRDEMRTSGSMKNFTIGSSVRHLISLVRVLAVAGFVSFENADVLSEALDDLGSFIQTARRSVLSESVRLSRDEMMDVRNKQKEYIKDIKDNTDNISEQGIKDTNKKITEQATSSVRYDRPITTDTSVKQATTTRPATTAFNNRVEGILEVLSSGKELGIKDIVINLPEYSEKMIQRELVGLVTSGTVQKIGFKRWSRYVLAPISPSNTPSQV